MIPFKHSRIFPVLLLLPAFFACREKPKNQRFELLDSALTGLTFRNDITESDSLNIFHDEFIYNGGGVGVGDFNGDGLQDLYFTGNQVENRLYLNRGGLKFEDITQKSGAQKRSGEWSSGINILDINRDGRADIYVCNTFVQNPELRHNLLFINQGNNPEGIPQFKEMAADYGIADTSHSSHAQFFDYDNDGDPDLFIGVNVMDSKNPNRYVEIHKEGTAQNCDRLYRNDGNRFTEVSKAAGLNFDGYSHSTLIADFNRDGWQDIYVCNDYVSNDLLYLNQRNGTFKNELHGVVKHLAASAMGSDMADINNDGLPDFFVTEMLPYYNKRKKLFLSGNNYSTYLNNDRYGYEYQYGRNVLQVHRGFDPETGMPHFSDVAFQTGTQETEWSWAPLLADFDNDGLRDLFVTNGFPRDVTDHDFTAYHSNVRFLLPPIELQAKIPQVKTPKFLFRNKGDLNFEDASAEFGVNVPAFSNGAAYADLDNDGDLELIVNNIDDEVFLFKNKSNDGQQKPNYLRLQLRGRPENPDAFGAEATVYFKGQAQTALVMSGRGYLSSPERMLHFGLGEATQADSVLIRWGAGESSVLTAVQANQVLKVNYSDLPKKQDKTSKTASIFKKLNPAATGLDFVSDDHDYVDFNTQMTLPHKYSQYGPAIAAGDIDGDGREDLLIGASAQNDATIFLQTPKQTFTRKNINLKSEYRKSEEDLATLLFDVEGDGDLDLYIARGSAQQQAGWEYYQDVLYLNDGKGNFSLAAEALPKENACNQAAKAADFDGDGDLDLLVTGRVKPLQYPRSDPGFLLRNDSKAGVVKFTDVTAEVCPELSSAGLISDALWTDFDNDRHPDILLAGEWMPLVFLRNENGKFRNISANSGVADQLGWWTSLAAADFDNDGDMDYIAGNYGENTYFKCTAAEPMHLYAKDFDGNGVYDPFLTCYWQDSLGRRREYIYHTRDDVLRQLIPVRKKFNTYGAFGEATLQDVFSKKELEGAQILSANYMSSAYVENLGAGKFRLLRLPAAAQMAPVFGILPLDFDADGLLDIVMIGNDFGMELLQGRADAFNGLLLKNTGNGQFSAINMTQSGIMIPGDGRALAQIMLSDGRALLLATQNTGPLLSFAVPETAGKMLALEPGETWAEVQFSDGRRRRCEFFRGSGFLSQNSHALYLPQGAYKILLFDSKGQQSRTLETRF